MRTCDLLSTPGQAGDGSALRAVPANPRTPGAGLARFWELRGQKVFEENGVLWGQYKGPCYVSLPFHLQLDPDHGEVEAVMRRHRIFNARVPSVTLPGVPCGMYVCRPAGYGLNSVDRRKRSHVRQGLETYDIRAIDADQLRAEGLPLNLQTMKRQCRYDAEFGDPARWARLTDAISRCPEIEVMGACLNGRLSAYVLMCREDGWLHLLYKMSRSEDLSENANAALDFTILSEAGRDPSIQAVGNWFAGFLSHPGLDRYKRQMGFAIVPNQLCGFYHPGVAPLLTSKLVAGTLRAASALRPNDTRWETMTMMTQSARINRIAPSDPPSVPESPCQQEHSRHFSRLRRPYPVFLAWRFLNRLRAEGAGATCRRVGRFLWRRIPGRRRLPASGLREPVAAAESLALQPLEWVEIKSEAEISATLDPQSKHRGLLFSLEMRRFCGRRFRVFKPVRKIFLEESRQSRELKNTVLLEGVHCDGSGFDCDRACFYFWREAWLRRVDPPRASTEILTRITIAGTN